MTACQITSAIGHLVVPVMAVSAAADFGADAALAGVYAGMLFAGSPASSLAMAGVTACTAVGYVPRRGVGVPILGEARG